MQKIGLKTGVFNESKEEGRTNILTVTSPLPATGGVCFAIVDVRGVRGNTEHFIECIRTHILECAHTTDNSPHPQHHFERLVDRINQDIAEADQHKQWNFPPDSIHALIGIASGNNLYLTGVGDLTTLFLHFDGHRYKIYNLLRNLQAENHLRSWEKLFSVVLDGDLHAGDRFIAGNAELLQHIDRDDLLSITTTLPPESAVEKMKQYFAFPSDVSLFVLRVDEQLHAPMEINSAGSSMNHLARTEDATTRFLEHQRPRKQDWSTFGAQAGTTALNIGKSALLVTLALFPGLLKSAWQGIQAIARADKSTITNKLKSVTQRAQQGLPRVSGGARRRSILPRGRNRTVALGTLGVIALLLVGGILFNAQRQNRKQERFVYTTTVEEIRSRFDNAQANIIYKDEENAQQLLEEARNLIAQAQENRFANEEELAALTAEIEEVSNELRRIRPITNLTLLAPLPEGTQAKQLARDNETSVVFMENGDVYTYNAQRSALERNTSAPENFNEPTRVRYDDLNDVFYAFDGRQIARLDTDQESYSIVTVTDLNTTTVDVDYYARRIYALSSGDEQVYRHDRAGNDFGAPSRWIEARTVSLADATSLSIDGSVWVLKANGNIVKYASGTEEAWTNTTPDPSIGSQAKLWTNENTDSLYILDPEGGRIIAIAKDTGLIKQQYTHESFQNLEGAWEVEGGTMHVLTPAGLHQFTL